MLSLESRAHFANFISQKCSGPLSFVAILRCKSSSRYSLMHILPTSSSKSASHPCTWVFLTCWSGNRAITKILCAFCRQLSQIEPRTWGNREPASASPGATIPEKKTQGFAHDAFTSELTSSRTVIHFPIYLMMVGWHDDVVDMMLGMLTMTIVGNSEVF